MSENWKRGLNVAKRLGVIVLGLYGAALALSLVLPRLAFSQALDAKTIDTLARIVNTTGVATWPRFSGATPFTCNANTAGAYYFRTDAPAFRTCNGTGWADGGGGAATLNDLTDVIITSPANNEVVKYNGSNWVNAASSASALNDLSDVTLTAPANTEILQYNGTQWVNVAGSSPAALSGLTDVVITSPALGQMLAYDGVNSWDNITIRGSYVLFPMNEQLSNHGATTDAVIAVDNDVRVFRYHFPYGCEVSRIAWNVRTQTGTGCDFGAVALYSNAGTTKIIDSGAQAYSANDTIINSDITNTFVPEGTYWVAYTASETTSCTVDAFAAPTPTTSPGIDALMNATTTLVGTAANQSVAGAMPATLGAITANTNVTRPVIKFICTDP